MLNGMKKLWSVTRQVTPHYYQSEAHAANEKAWLEYDRVLDVAPTGSGKSILAGEHVARRVETHRRVLVLAHTQKLVLQFRDSLEKNYGIMVGVEMGDRKPGNEPVICGTFQTMLRRLDKYPPDTFSLMIFDEAHLSLGDGWQTIAAHFKCKILGLTATPRRGDQKDLMKFFEYKAVDIPLFKLIKEGFLCNILWKNIPINIRIEGASKTGDITEQECAHAIEPYLPACCEAYAAEAKGRCGMIFLPLIETSKKTTVMLQELGIKAMHVDGTMKEKDTRDIITKLEKGEIEVICNSMLLTVGVDIRPINCIMMLRPTKSWTLFTQTVGRGTRTFDPAKHGIKGTIWPFKTELLFLDPLWLCSKHNLIKRPACLLATSEEEEAQLEEKMKKGMDILEAKQSITQDREESLAKELERLAKRKARLASAFEVFAGTGDVDGAEYEPMSRWQRDKITPGQEAILRSEGIDLESVKDKGHGVLIIEAIKQRRLSGLANTRLAHEALQSGMTDALTRGREDVVEYLSAIKRGENPYADIPPI